VLSVCPPLSSRATIELNIFIRNGFEERMVEGWAAIEVFYSPADIINRPHFDPNAAPNERKELVTLGSNEFEVPKLLFPSSATQTR
jgi:hypothetical protein